MKKEHRKLRHRPMFVPLLAPVIGGVLAAILMVWLWAERGVSTVILVRHADIQQAEAGQATLTDTGLYRSRSLAGWLKESGLTRIYVDDYPPTRETAKPVARVTGAEIVQVPGNGTGTLIERLHELRNETVLVIGSRETLPDIVQALAGRRPEIPEDEYSLLFIVTDSLVTRARLLSLRYGG